MARLPQKTADHMVLQEENPISHGKSAPDRFTLGPFWPPVAFALVTGTVLSFEEIFGLLLIPIGALAALVWLPVMLVYVYQALKRAQWRRAASFLAILIGSWPIMGIEIYCGDYVHFALAYPFYELQTENTPDRYSKQTEFRWSGRGFAGTVSSDRTVVYDQRQ